MTDLEISKALALAIGWPGNCVTDSYGVCYVNKGIVRSYWSIFDYRDPAVIWPIAERYDAFPFRVSHQWCTNLGRGMSNNTYDYSAAKAVALAVIGTQS